MTYLRLFILGLLPVLFCVWFLLLTRKTKFKNLKDIYKQIIVGAVFGGLAIIGTECGLTLDGFTVNVRDAAPLIAGLIFGPWAGIISGLIGGIERYIAVLWGIGMYTRVACSVATFLSGAFGGLLYIVLFKKERPKWYYGLACGIIAETFHMLMVFVTNIRDAHNAYRVVKACAIPMISATAVSVALACLAVGLIEHRAEKKKSRFTLTVLFQRSLAITISIAFIATTFFISTLEKNLVKNDTYQTMELNINDIVKDVKTKSDMEMLETAKSVARDIEMTYTAPESDFIKELAKKYDICEVNYVNTGAVIYSSNVDEYIGFHMGSGEQSKEFMCLLMGEQSFVQDYQATTNDSQTFRKYAGIRLKIGGFVQIGFDWEDVEEGLAKSLENSADNRRIGQDGYIIVADIYGNIVSDRFNRVGQNIKDLGLTDIIHRTNDTEMSKVNIDGEEMLMLARMSEGYYIIALIPKAEANFSKDMTTNITVFLEIIVYGCLFIIIFLLIKELVIKRIHKMNGGLNKITGGDLNVVLSEDIVSEFIDLSDDVNKTVDRLKQLIEDAKERVRKELEFATLIQEGALPKEFPPREGEKRFDIFASMDPAKEVGGDFYDFYYIDDDHFAFMVSDVSGKGIPAAMFMMTAKTLIKNLAMSKLPINEIYMRANKELSANNEANMFVTSWMGICDLKTGVVKFTNAGHNPPLVKHRDGRFEYLRSKVNFVLAGMPGAKYNENEIVLKPGDEIYLYTDGVTEATSKDIELFGEERLLKVLNKEEYETSRDVLKAVKKDVDKFADGIDQFDDITMLSFKYKG